MDGSGTESPNSKSVSVVELIQSKLLPDCIKRSEFTIIGLAVSKSKSKPHLNIYQIADEVASELNLNTEEPKLFKKGSSSFMKRWTSRLQGNPGDPNDEEDQRIERLMAQLNFHEQIFGYRPNSRKNQELYDKYLKQIKESEGFDIDCYPDDADAEALHIVSWTKLLDDPPSARTFYLLANIAIADFNRNHGENYKLFKVITVNCGRGFVYYLTFEAKKEEGDPLVTFQARVQDAIPHEKAHVQICRIKN